jgi:hypothetical protein
LSSAKSTSAVAPCGVKKEEFESPRRFWENCL